MCYMFLFGSRRQARLVMVCITLFARMFAMDCEIITDVIIGMFGQSYLKVELEDPKIMYVPDFVIEGKR